MNNCRLKQRTFSRAIPQSRALPLAGQSTMGSFRATVVGSLLRFWIGSKCIAARVEDRGENEQLDVYREFKVNINGDEHGRYEVRLPWIPGTKLSETNELQSRLRLKWVENKLECDEDL